MPLLSLGVRAPHNYQEQPIIIIIYSGQALIFSIKCIAFLDGHLSTSLITRYLPLAARRRFIGPPASSIVICWMLFIYTLIMIRHYF